MISDPVERWQRRLGESTWEAYDSHWYKFLEVMKISDPAELLKLSPREASDLAVEFYDILKKENYSSKSCALGHTVVRSFFSHNGVKLEKFVKKFSGHVEYERGFQITQQQVYELIEAVPKWRNKFIVGLCFSGGQRAGICTGLKFRHIQTRNWETARVVVFDIPAFLPNVRGRNVNKWNVKYRFGLLDDVIRYLVLHVKEREGDGETITPESWLIRSLRGNAPPRRNYIREIVSGAAERIGIQKYFPTRRKKQRKALIHPHVGRIFCKTQLRKSGVDPELRDFLMGHKPKYEGAYDKYDEAEITTAMEQARLLLAVAPKVVTEIEWRKKKLLEQAVNVLPAEKLEQLENLLKHATTHEELQEVLDNFKNGRVKLEPIKR